MTRPLTYRKTRYHYHALLAITALAFGGLATATVAVTGDTRPPIDNTAAVAVLQETSSAFSAVAKLATPAVVNIKIQKRHALPTGANPLENVPEGFGDDFLKRFFGDRVPREFSNPKFHTPKSPGFASGQGSGFIISEDGYILTNAHVVDGATKMTVRLADGREFGAKLIGSDTSSDVAVVKIEAADLPMLTMGDSDQLEVAQWVLAVGSPFGLPGTVTSGIVSAKGRSRVGIADYENFIQTDAAINPGNSGGPLLNLKGEVVGINTAIFSRTGAFNGIGFAIPINMARDICNQLMENGSVTRGWLGVSIQELTAELSESFGLAKDTRGVLIADVVPDSPAAKAGLTSGDVIVQFNDRPIDNLGAFRNRIARLAPETKIELEVVRDGDRQAIEVTIGQLAAKDAVATTTEQSAEALGLTVAPLTDKLAEQHGYQGDTGVLITQVASGSAAGLAGIQAGSLITEVNRKPISNVKEFETAIDEAKQSDTVMLRFKQGEYSRYAVLKFQQ